MRLPNKLYSYHESILSKFPVVLNALQNEDFKVGDLYLYVRNYIVDANEYLQIIDCLYALDRIAYDEESEVLTYVE